MKFRVKNTNETLPVVEDSLICGLRPDGNEVEFSVNDVELIPNDWSSFRREAAKDILASLASWNIEHSVQDEVKLAINYANELIEQLKYNEKS